MDLNDRVARGRLIASMVAADDKVTKKEEAFLDKSLERLGLDDEERAQALGKVGVKEAEKVISNLDRIERLDFLNDLAQAAYADGELDKSEETFITRLSKVMKLDKADLGEALGRARALAN